MGLETPVQARGERDGRMRLRRPYLIFLGAVTSATDAKTGFGLRDWAREACLGETALPGCAVTLGLATMTPREAAAAGAGSLVIGVAPPGGRLPAAWLPTLEAAVDAGLDVVSGLHDRLADAPGLVARAARRGVRLHDVRHASGPFPVGSGRKRSGRRVLTVGSDCAVGKKYAALALARELRRRGLNADFRATGQTGILIAGQGVAIDAVVADFISGAAEALSPDAAPDHWDVVEGQGSLFHPSYAGVSLGLLHGSQPDALVLCHDPARDHVDDHPDLPLPTLEEAVRRNEEAARLTNPRSVCVGVSLNTSRLDPAAARALLDAASARLGLPAMDPLRGGVEAVADALERL